MMQKQQTQTSTDAAPEPSGLFWRLLGPAAVCLYLAALCLGQHADQLDAPIVPEDAFWIGGGTLGSSLRLTQHVIAHYLGLWLASQWILYCRLPSLVIHWANAVLIYALVVTLLVTLPSAVGRKRWLRQLAGVSAAALFVLSGRQVTGYISALSYQLVLLFILLFLLMFLFHIRTRKVVLWAATLLALVGALLSHSYSVGLPLFALVLELAWRRRQPDPPPWRGTIVRYLTLLLPTAATVIYLLFVVQGEANYPTPLVALQNAGLFGRYLLLALLAVFPLDLEPLSGPVEIVDIAVVIAAVAALSWGLRQLLFKRGDLGPASLLGLPLLANALVFPQTMVGEGFDLFLWRYYYNGWTVAAAAGCLLALLALPLARLSRLLPRPGIWASVALLCAALGVAAHPRIRHPLLQTLRGKLPLAQQPTSNRRPLCDQLVPATRDQVLAAVTSGQPLTCRRLGRANLSGLDLSGLNFSGSSLVGGNAAKAQMAGLSARGSIWLWSDLSFSNMRRADLRGAALAWANLSDVRFDGADLRRADLSGAQLTNARLIGANLRHATITWTRIDVSDMSRADLSYIHLPGGVLRGTRLTGAILYRAKMSGLDVCETDMQGADLREADMPALLARKANLANATLRKANLWRADLRGANLSGADLRETNLSEARLENTDLRGADLRGAECAGVRFLGARLDGADLRGARLRGARFDRGQPASGQAKIEEKPR